MYDLYMSDEDSLKEYRYFRKRLIKRGYMMMQNSIYCKVINGQSSSEIELTYLKKEIPKKGNIRVLKITDSQYNKIEIIRGSKRINETINTADRRIKINYEIN